MSIPSTRSNYQLVTYLSARQAARLAGISEHTLSKAVCEQFIGAINLPGDEVFVRWNDLSKIFSTSIVGRDVDATPSAEPAARGLNYKNFVPGNDAPHVRSQHGDAS